MPTKDQMTDEEFNRWLAAYRATRQSLVDARLALVHKMDDALFSDKLDIQTDIDAIDDQINALDNLRLDFYANRTALTPPTKEQVAEIERLATQVDRLVGNAQLADSAAQIAGQALAGFRSAIR